eukprot:GHVR01037421.1.p1 GENE.GHVR01037421.1~~GHVR01037421.1.p1  ORF type:complete len:121 (-),score=2.53 GHVR01037421.1:514-876(-)
MKTTILGLVLIYATIGSYIQKGDVQIIAVCPWESTHVSKGSHYVIFSNGHSNLSPWYSDNYNQIEVKEYWVGDSITQTFDLITNINQLNIICQNVTLAVSKTYHLQYTSMLTIQMTTGTF